MLGGLVVRLAQLRGGKGRRRLARCDPRGSLAELQDAATFFF